MSDRFIVNLLRKICPDMGVKVVFESTFEWVGYLEFADGARSFFRNTNFGINPQGATEIARDKGYAAYFLRQFGYSVPDHVLLVEPELASKMLARNPDYAGKMKNMQDARDFAQKSGWPLVVKPNDKSQGQGVYVVHDMQEMEQAISSNFGITKHVLVEKFHEGQDYRVVVLGDQVISAYQRMPLVLEGNGHDDVATLLRQRQEELERIGRDTVIPAQDPRITANLSRQGLSWASVPEQGTKITCFNNANLSTGGEARDVTGEIHPDYARLCINVARDMDLTLCGVDVLTPSLTKPLGPYVIVEINAAPGLDNYASMGQKQQLIVEDLYRQVIRQIGDIKSNRPHPSCKAALPRLTQG